ncbi:MAG: FHA domain-containing protein [Lachnospiraceae bacterium]|nr:FHA domain-containing protein [Lachnospiraceae bacterium]
MNLVRCENGHFYDSERFQICPHCNQGSVSTVLQDENGEAMYTMPISPDEEADGVYTMPINHVVPGPVPVPAPAPAPPTPTPMPAPAAPSVQEKPAGNMESLIAEVKKADDGGQATVGYFGDMGKEPVVGWLTAVEGKHFGEDFRLKTGRNFIGRSGMMDIALTDDPSISREKHAIILYEPRANVFLVQPGDAKELFYLNDKVVLAATEIVAYDVLSLGNTKLLFIPLCSDRFNWDAVKKEEDK